MEKTQSRLITADMDHIIIFWHLHKTISINIINLPNPKIINNLTETE